MTNSNSISIYNFNQNQVRTTQIDNEPWFCLADCSAALSIRQIKTDRLPVKGVTICHTLTNGGKQELTFINEPNLYRLIFRSNKPQAQAFADWVYSEVLPQIRKTGAYGVPAETALAPLDAKTLGGIVKRCTAAAVREELEAMTKCNHDATVKLTAMLFENAINDRVQHQLKDKLNKINALLAE